MAARRPPPRRAGAAGGIRSLHTPTRSHADVGRGRSGMGPNGETERKWERAHDLMAMARVKAYLASAHERGSPPKYNVVKQRIVNEFGYDVMERLKPQVRATMKSVEEKRVDQRSLALEAEAEQLDANMLMVAVMIAMLSPRAKVASKDNLALADDGYFSRSSGNRMWSGGAASAPSFGPFQRRPDERRFPQSSRFLGQGGLFGDTWMHMLRKKFNSGQITKFEYQHLLSIHVRAQKAERRSKRRLMGNGLQQAQLVKGATPSVAVAAAAAPAPAVASTSQQKGPLTSRNRLGSFLSGLSAPFRGLAGSSPGGAQGQRVSKVAQGDTRPVSTPRNIFREALSHADVGVVPQVITTNDSGFDSDAVISTTQSDSMSALRHADPPLMERRAASVPAIASGTDAMPGASVTRLEKSDSMKDQKGPVSELVAPSRPQRLDPAIWERTFPPTNAALPPWLEQAPKDDEMYPPRPAEIDLPFTPSNLEEGRGAAAAAAAVVVAALPRADPQRADQEQRDALSRIRRIEQKYHRKQISKYEFDMLIDMTNRAEQMNTFQPPERADHDTAASSAGKTGSPRSFDFFRRWSRNALLPRSHNSARSSVICDETTISDLPDEILIFIFLYLEPSSFLTLGLVCRRWYTISTTDSVWKTCYARKLKSMLKTTTFTLRDVLPNVQARGMSWYEAYCRDFALGFSAADGHGKAKVRILLVGDQKTGKSSFSTRFCKGTFDPRYKKTRDFVLQTRVATVDGVELCFEIWEIGDVHRHRMGIFHRLRHCDAVLCTFNPADAASLHHCQDWIEFVCKFRDRGNLVRVMLGCFADQKAGRAVSDSTCADIARRCSAQHYECSSATGVGVDAVLCHVARRVGQVGPEPIRHLFKPPPGEYQPHPETCSTQ
eukprot:CAMPEP_0206300724 /NCGR_PEP_ID=MMETSP0106_2-20121207/7851_1 /ASSEMBLY_ACC=CAM_ASM_000206 /TAXON_ID=81532 /ORGANISM="Acanthoeca-like sp., Strain 10tr" /LENGTH=890 /DNA_ID=CAMNT_0053731461 /DNA_START=108 /DNA_END=2779 /DNA_ORIENTATION=+